ncbi:MAG: 3-phosphoserine/phosphohydroxythreonine transaminase [Flavobacteriaceae bacterium]|nr:3-phosphoserine/phosphohydroxythreonine transaminase [Flavobacteriaceae bacterium]
MKKHNFSAGPSILPREVIEQASRDLLDFNGLGLSVLEISHRSKDFVAVMDKACALALEHLGLTDKGYTALFLQGGANTQFLMAPYNLLERSAAYLNTGTWASKAIKEAQLFGQVHEVASSKDRNFCYIPKNYTIPEAVDYFHCTSNNTIFGTQIHSFPDTTQPLVCDMSSDIFSRVLDFSKFDLIYAGAQKNMGPAGTTLVVIKNDILGKVSRSIPSMLDYRTHIDKESMFNTPPVFAVHVSMLTLEWLKAQGGVMAIEKQNKMKSERLYQEIERNSLFRGFADIADRSMMNVTFNLTDDQHKEKFNTLCQEAGISGLNGHRSVGGYRASIYNALPLNSVDTLIEVMSEFERKA